MTTTVRNIFSIYLSQTNRILTVKNTSKVYGPECWRTYLDCNMHQVYHPFNILSTFFYTGVEFSHIPPDFFCASSHDPDDLAQLGIDAEGGGLARGCDGVDGTSSSRKTRICASLEYSRPKSDRYIHKIRSAEHGGEFYDLNPGTDPETRLADKLASVESGVPETDDVQNPKYNNDW